MNWRTRLQTGKAAALSFMAAALVLSAIGTPANAAPLAQTDDTDDWARVKAAGKIVVGVSADYPPFEFYDSNYQLDGFDIALFKAVAQQMGVQVEFNDFAFDGLLTTVRLKQVDAAISAISVTANRRQLVDFSNLYYVGSDAALVKSSYEGTILSAADLAGLKVGVEKGTTYQNWVQESAVDKGVIPQNNLVQFDNVDAMITSLRAADGVDVAVLGALPAQTYDARFNNIRTAGTNFNRQQFGIAARNGSTLIAQFNAALTKVQANGTYARIADQYLQARAALPSGAASKVDNADVADAAAAAKANPAAAATAAAPNTVTEAAAAAPVCENGMAFVADLNLDDKNMTAPPILKLNQSFSKGWRLRNTGTCAWQPNFTVSFVSGNRDGAQMQGKPIELYKTVQPGETIDVSANLVAPNSYGTFQGFWKLRDSNGQYFGEVFWVGIQIPNPNPPPTPPAPPPNTTINPNLRADAAWIKAGQCNTIRWDVDNINAAFFVDGGNATGVGGHDSRSVCPKSTTTYTLRVVGRNNVSTDFPIVINVDGSASAIGVNFWVDNTTINTGQCTNLHWNTQNAAGVYLNQGAGEALVGLAATIQVCPTSNNVYTLRVVGNDGSQQSPQVTVNVVNTGVTPPVITGFTTNSNQVSAGTCIPISWTTANTSYTRVSLNGAVQQDTAPANGGLNVCLFNRGIQQLTLTAFGNGQVSQQFTVQVN